MAGWHYLPVVKGAAPDEYITLIEVHVDDDDKLIGWSGKKLSGEDYEAVAIGNDTHDLIGALILMLGAAHRYKPVRYEDLREGMKCERRGTLEEALGALERVRNGEPVISSEEAAKRLAASWGSDEG